MNGFVLGFLIALCGFVLALSGYKICETDHIALAELEQNGYSVIRHAETHGAFHTNWVEVVRTDGRPL